MFESSDKLFVEVVDSPGTAQQRWEEYFQGEDNYTMKDKTDSNATTLTRHTNSSAIEDGNMDHVILFVVSLSGYCETALSGKTELEVALKTFKNLNEKATGVIGRLKKVRKIILVFNKTEKFENALTEQNINLKVCGLDQCPDTTDPDVAYDWIAKQF